MVARDKPPDNLMPTAVLRWTLTSPGPGPLPAEQPVLSSGNVPHWPGSNSDESHLDARLRRQPHLWPTPVFKWTSRQPGPVGATPAFGRPGNPTEFSDSDRRGPWARDPVPGRIKNFNSSNSEAIPPTVRWARRTRTGLQDTRPLTLTRSHRLDQSYANNCLQP